MKAASFPEPTALSMSSEFIAFRVVTARDGTEHRIGLAAPEPDDKHGDWYCRVTFTPLIVDKAIYGVDAFQALHLALRLLESEFQTTIDRGGIEEPDCLFDATMAHR